MIQRERERAYNDGVLRIGGGHADPAPRSRSPWPKLSKSNKKQKIRNKSLVKRRMRGSVTYNIVEVVRLNAEYEVWRSIRTNSAEVRHVLVWVRLRVVGWWWRQIKLDQLLLSTISTFASISTYHFF